jgi:S1-C subfamily serine protease
MHPQYSVPAPGVPDAATARRISRLRTTVVALIVVIVGLVAAGIYGAIKGEERFDAMTKAQLRLRKQVTGLDESLTHQDSKVAEMGSTLEEVRAKLEIAQAETLDVERVAGRIEGSVFTIYSPSEEPVSQGTGFVAAADDQHSWIATNHHVIADAGRGTVTLVQGEDTWTATVYSTDEEQDLALLEVDQVFPVLPDAYAEGHEPERGDQVMAYGSPYGLEDSATVGIVSALRDEIIQTDALIDHGNSGGPLVNTDGEVIGINSAIYGTNGIGLAIDVRVLCDKLLTTESCG